jgi:hypothetical protein
MRNKYHVDGAGEFAWKALAIIRLVNGALALVAPRWLARRLGVDPAAQPAMLYALRMFGIRTVLIGAELWLQPETRQRSLRQGIVIHASDVTAALIAGVFGQLRVRSALTAGGISMLNTALAVFASARTARRNATK